MRIDARQSQRPSAHSLLPLVYSLFNFLLPLVLGRIANFDDSIHDLHELDEANNELNHDPNRDLANHDLQFMTHNSLECQRIKTF